MTTTPQTAPSEAPEAEYTTPQEVDHNPPELAPELEDHVDETPEKVDEKLKDLGVRTQLTVRADAIFAELLALTEDDSSLKAVENLIRRLHNAVRRNIYLGHSAQAVHVIDIAEKVLTRSEEEDGSLLDSLLDTSKYLPGIAKVDGLLDKFFDKKGGEIQEVQEKLASLRSDLAKRIPDVEREKLDEEKSLTKEEREAKSKELEQQITKAIDDNTGWFGKILGLGKLQKGALAFAIGRGLTDVDATGEPLHKDVEKFIENPSTLGFFAFALGNLFGSKKEDTKVQINELTERLESYEGNANEIFFEKQQDIAVFSQDRFHIVTDIKKKEMAVQIGAYFYVIEKKDGFELSDDTIESVDITQEDNTYTLKLKVDGDEYTIGLNNFLAENSISENDPKKSIHLDGELTLERRDDTSYFSRLKKYIPRV